MTRPSEICKYQIFKFRHLRFLFSIQTWQQTLEVFTGPKCWIRSENGTVQKSARTRSTLMNFQRKRLDPKGALRQSEPSQLDPNVVNLNRPRENTMWNPSEPVKTSKRHKWDMEVTPGLLLFNLLLLLSEKLYCISPVLHQLCAHV